MRYKCSERETETERESGMERRKYVREGEIDI